VQITNNGSVKTLRVTTDNGNYNANFYILIPVYTPPASMPLAVSTGGGNLDISFSTQPGYSYQAEYKTNLTDAAWIPLGNVISGDGTTQTAIDMPGDGSRFYRVRSQ
jgi:hypothetical protein